MKYRLFVILPQNIPDGEEYFLVTASYCLLYTNAEQTPTGAKEVTKIHTLPALAKEWLAECIDDIRKKALAQQKQTLLTETAPAFYTALHAALESEKKALETSGGENKEFSLKLEIEQDGTEGENG